MPFDYEANVLAVRTALRDTNTTTSSPDLSSGMTTRVRTVEIDDPEKIGVRLADLPAVYVRVQSGEEEAAGLGSTGPTGTRKFKEVNYELMALYHRDGALGTHAGHLTELYRFAENMEGVFQSRFTLSGTALWCHPVTTNFGAFDLEQGDRVKGFITTLRAKYLFR